MIVKLKIKTHVNSDSKANELYCLLYDKYTSFFKLLKEDKFSYRCGNLLIVWSGDIKNLKGIREKVIAQKLETIFRDADIKKCQFEIMAGNKSYKYLYNKERGNKK